jgi:acetyl-CoA carboxylase biotin carboxyl carrier protein
VNLEEIKALIDILKGTDVTEINFEEEGKKIRIKKGQQINAYENVSVPAQTVHMHSKEQERKEEKGENSRESKYKGEKIVAPMVGTFYRAPFPDAEPFVRIGDIVNPGDTLCIIEAMKLMNEIETENKGKIIDILVENAEPVEYGQALFIIEPLQ